MSDSLASAVASPPIIDALTTNLGMGGSGPLTRRPTNPWGWGWSILSVAACAVVGVLVVKMTGEEEYPLDIDAVAKEDNGDYSSALNENVPDALYLDGDKDDSARDIQSIRQALLKYDDDDVTERILGKLNASGLIDDTTSMPAWAEEMMKMTREIASDIKEIKAVLALKEGSGNGNNSDSSKSDDDTLVKSSDIANSNRNGESIESKKDLPILTLDERIGKVRSAVELIKNNYLEKNKESFDELKGGCQNLYLIVSKLLEPNDINASNSSSSGHHITKTPRYHKITTTNSLFRKNVVDVLDGYESLLESIGFTLKNSSGSKSYEWTWGQVVKDSGDSSLCPSEEDIIKIIQECLASLNALKDFSVSSPVAAAPEASNSNGSTPLPLEDYNSSNSNSSSNISSNSSATLLSSDSILPSPSQITQIVDNKDNKVGLSFDEVRMAVRADQRSPKRS